MRDWEVELADDFFWFLAANLPLDDDGDRVRWSWQRMGILISARFIINCEVLLPLFFFGKVFRKLRHPGVSLSSFGQSPGIGFSWVIICRIGGLILLTSASCVVVERWWIICCYIVGRLIVYGTLSLVLLGFRGFSQDWLQISCFVGGIDWGSIHLAFGI